MSINSGLGEELHAIFVFFVAMHNFPPSKYANQLTVYVRRSWYLFDWLGENTLYHTKNKWHKYSYRIFHTKVWVFYIIFLILKPVFSLKSLKTKETLMNVNPEICFFSSPKISTNKKVLSFTGRMTFQCGNRF